MATRRLLKVANPTLNGASLQYFDSATDPNFPLTASGPVYNTISGVRTQIVQTGFGNVSQRLQPGAPGEVDFDASVSKDFKLYRRLNFQFRVDAFNVINHTNFTSPSGSLSGDGDRHNRRKQRRHLRHVVRLRQDHRHPTQPRSPALQPLQLLTESTSHSRAQTRSEPWLSCRPSCLMARLQPCHKRHPHLSRL